MHLRIITLSLFFLLISSFGAFSQEDLMSVLDKDEKPKTEYTSATFKTTRIIIGQSVENAPKGDMLFIITHHFGALNTGYDNLFGLKQATIRLGLEYGLTNRLGIGFGLNTYKNTWDGFLKYKLLRQSTGVRRMPFTLTLFGSTSVYTSKWEVPDRKNYFTSRINYAFQILLARKFGERLSLQLSPSFIHKNLVVAAKDQNNIFAAGAGGRFKISPRVSINAEYYYLFPHQIYSQKRYNSFSAGVDIETGGHVFQIFLTNSMGENEETFIPETTGTWNKGTIFLGFNITRVFTIVKPKVFL
ncbi:MAG: DUF5777 family beta-barrel protein [Bacteroidetes bacterium]|nr:DUF5777 family beta-barrel protein [Bacteroidota bacterium]